MHKPIIVASMSRAGSMWTYNIARSLVKAAGLERVPERVPKNSMELLQRLWGQDLGPYRVLCIKTHRIISNFEREPAKFICPYRDVRDAMMSFMRFTKCDFQGALAAATEMMRISEHYLGTPATNILPIRYDDIQERPLSVVGSLADFVGYELEDQMLEHIAGEYSFTKMKPYTAELKSKVESLQQDSGNPDNNTRYEIEPNYDGSARVFDSTTGFQSGHITSVNAKSWRDELSQVQQDQVMDLTKNWLLKHEFPL